MTCRKDGKCSDEVWKSVPVNLSRLIWRVRIPPRALSGGQDVVKIIVVWYRGWLPRVLAGKAELEYAVPVNVRRLQNGEGEGRGARGAISLLCGEPEFQISLKHVFRVRIPGWPQGGDQDVVGCREFLQFHVVTSLQSADKAGLNGWALLAFG